MKVEKLSPKTIVNLNLFLHRALSFALGEGYIALNPAEAVNLPRGQKPQIEILTRDQQARLIQASLPTQVRCLCQIGSLHRTETR